MNSGVYSVARPLINETAIRLLSRLIPRRGCSSVVERTLRMCEAPGSIPGISTIFFLFALPPKFFQSEQLCFAVYMVREFFLTKIVLFLQMAVWMGVIATVIASLWMANTSAYAILDGKGMPAILRWKEFVGMDMTMIMVRQSSLNMVGDDLMATCLNSHIEASQVPVCISSSLLPAYYYCRQSEWPSLFCSFCRVVGHPI